MATFHDVLERGLQPGADFAVLAAELLELLARDGEGAAADVAARVESLCFLLENYPRYRAGLRAGLHALLTDVRAASLYSEAGILANTGFFTDLWRRLGAKLLPPPRDDALRGVVALLFDERAAADWMEALDPRALLALLAALRFDEEPDGPWQGGWLALLEAMDMLAVRIAALGLEPELARHYRVPREQQALFLALGDEVRARVQAARSALRDGGLPAGDDRHLQVLLGQCADVMAAVRRSARRQGASLALTFLLRRLAQSVQRLDLLAALVQARLGHAREPVYWQQLALLVRELAAAERRDYAVREHLRENTTLLALLVTENASRTGEHYIGSTRADYAAMFHSAIGAGAIVGFMAIMKVLLAKQHLPPLVEAIGFSFNYAFGFVLIYILHFTIATKQPAMTASTIAATLESAGRERRPSFDNLGLLVSRVARTQFIAIVGNVALALPAALLLCLAMAGAVLPVADAAKARLLLDDLHPWLSPALFHAAIAGVWLFLAGLVSGYFDNLAVYERIPERVRRVRWLHRLLGEARLARFSGWIEDHLGGLAGNVFFGFMLGMTGFVGYILGLPLDIRHVTFSAANLSIAVVGADFAVPAGVLLVAVLGTALIALCNLAVSFSLALLVALRARNLRLQHGGALLAAVGRRFRRQPLAFLFPPRVEAEIR